MPHSTIQSLQPGKYLCQQYLGPQHMSSPASVCTWTVRTCLCAGTSNIEFTHYLLTAGQAQCIRQAQSETRLTQGSKLVETSTAQGPPCEYNTSGIHANWPDCKHNSALGLHGCVYHPRQRVVDGTADAKLPLDTIQGGSAHAIQRHLTWHICDVGRL